jgi:HAD superfamily hydrolase (TIGR01509 family)
MKITTVLLDAGGVVLDEFEHEKVRAQLIVEALGTVIPGYSISLYRADVEEAVRSFCPRTYQYVFWKYLKPDRQLFHEFYTRHLNRWKERRPPLKLSSGIERELEAISQDFKVALAGQYGEEILGLLKTHSLLNHFTQCLTHNDFRTMKPDTRYYEEIVQALHVNPEQCIMVGDRIDNDIIPAKLLSMGTVLIRVGIHGNQQPRIPFEAPDVELDGVPGLAGAVQRVTKK